jgi:hypothetical protein
VISALVTAAVVAIPVPAHAESLQAGCTDSGFRLKATAYYAPTGAWNQWTGFDYQLLGGTGNKSNVNLWVLSDFSTRYTYFSPDSLQNTTVYTHTPPYPVLTEPATYEVTQFEAIFDVFGPDPRCPASTQPI